MNSAGTYVGCVVALFGLAGCGGGGNSRTDGGALGDGGTPLLDGGRRASSWRDGLSSIVNDVEGWQVPPESQRVLYPDGARHSPITAAVARHLRHVALHGQGLEDNVFMKVGDSITASAYYLGCFEGDVNARAPSWEFNVILDGRTELADAIFHFRSALIGRDSPFERTSRAAKVGATADWPLAGRTPPLETELAGTNAQFATVMFGTNDLGEGGAPDVPLEMKLVPYARHLLALIDWMLVRGVVPVMSTIPPRDDQPEYRGLALVMNAVVRAIAQGRQVPLVDYHQAMVPLLDLGLGGDGVHPSLESYNTGCHFDAEGLGWGYNTRNLVMLEGLHRAMHTVVDGDESLDPQAERLRGDGTRAAPFVIPSLPFSDLRDIEGAVANQTESYGCADAGSGSGRENLYQLTVTSPIRVRAAVIDATPVPGPDAGVLPLDLDLYLLDATGAASGCVKTADEVITTNLEPGTWYFAVDHALATSLSPSGEYVFVVVPCKGDDRLCEELAGP